MKKLILPFLILITISVNSQTTWQVCVSEVSNAPCSNNTGVFTPANLNIAVGDDIQFTTWMMAISGGYDGSNHQIRFNGGTPQDVVLPVSANILSQMTTITTAPFNTPGIYTMECINSAHCFNFAQILENWNCTGYSVTVGTITEIEEEKLKHKVRVYPNPTSGVININLLPIKNKHPKVYIMDVLGKTVDVKENITTDILTIDASSYKKGIYFIKISTDNATVTKKVIIN